MYYIDSFEVAIYGGYINLIVVKDANEYKKFLKDYNFEVDDYEGFSAITIEQSVVGEALDVWFVIFKLENLMYFDFKEVKNNILEDLIHELVHLKNLIYSSRGIMPDVENDEPEAYLLSYLHYEIRKLLKKYLDENVKDLE